MQEVNVQSNSMRSSFLFSIITLQDRMNGWKIKRKVGHQIQMMHTHILENIRIRATNPRQITEVH